jgi:hypothetical protein
MSQGVASQKQPCTRCLLRPSCELQRPGFVFTCFCEARVAGLSPCFAPVRSCGGGGVYFGLVRRALCIFAPRSTPNELGLIAVTLFSEGRVAVWPLAVAAEERQHAIHHCLGSRAVLQASPDPIATHLHYVTISNSLWPGGRLARAAGCLLGICSQVSCCCSHKMHTALNRAAAPARGSGLIMYK